MKKLVLMFAAVAAISFASCNGNKTAQAEEVIDSVEEAIDSLVEGADSVVADTTVAE